MIARTGWLPRISRIPAARTFVSAVAVASLGVILSAAPARAQSDSSAKKAQKHFDRGAELYVEGKYSKAVIEFRKAYRLREHPVFLYNMVRSYARLGNCDLVRDTADKIDDPKQLDGESNAKLRANVEACRQVQRARRQTRTLAARASPEPSPDEERQSEEPQPEETSESEAPDETDGERTASREEPEETDDEDRSAERPPDTRNESPPRSGGIPPAYGWATLAVGGATLGAGVLQDWLSMRSRLSELDSSETVDPDTKNDLTERAQTARTVSIILYAAGGGLAVTGVTLVVLGQSSGSTAAADSPANPPRLRAGVGPAGAPIGLELEW